MYQELELEELEEVEANWVDALDLYELALIKENLDHNEEEEL